MARPVTITDPEDPRLAGFRALQNPKHAAREGLFVAESAMLLRQVCRHPARIAAVLLAEGCLENLQDCVDGLPSAVPVYTASNALLRDIVGFRFHRGVLALCRRPTAEELHPDRALADVLARPRVRLLVAEGATDPRNLGSLFRNAALLGVDGLLLDPTSADPYYRQCVRVSIGHVLSLPWARAVAWPLALEQLRERAGLRLFGAETAPGARPLWELPDAARCALVFGAEGRGLEEATLARLDACFAIPMAGPGSLNVAAASAVVLYELVRRGS